MAKSKRLEESKYEEKEFNSIINGSDKNINTRNIN